MKRREFLKLAAILPFSGMLLGKSNPMPSEMDKSSAALWECADFASQEAPFVLHEGIWFFSEKNIIRFCAKTNLNGFWNSFTIPFCSMEAEFDFWLKDNRRFPGNRLLWCGKHSVWEILTNPVRIQFVKGGLIGDL